MAWASATARARGLSAGDPVADRGLGALRQSGRVQPARQRPSPAVVLDDASVHEVLRQVHAGARIAARNPVDGVAHQPHVGHVAEEREEQRFRVLLRERGKRQRDRAAAQHLDRPRRLRPCFRGHDDQELVVVRLVGEGNQERRGLVGKPVHVVHGDQHGLLTAHGDDPAIGGPLCRRTRPRDRAARRTRRPGIAALAAANVARARSTIAPSAFASNTAWSRTRVRPSPGAASISTERPRPAKRRWISSRRSRRSSSRPTRTGVDRYACDTCADSARSIPAIAASRCITSNALRGRSAGSRLSSDSTSASSASGRPSRELARRDRRVPPGIRTGPRNSAPGTARAR